MKRLIIVIALLLLAACESKSFNLTPTPLTSNQTNEHIVESSLLPTSPESTSAATPTQSFTDLSATLILNKNGFKLESETKDGNFFVMQTLQIPNSPRVVHIMRKIDINELNQRHYRESVVIIHPDTQEMHVYSMTNSPITDEYSVDSVARVYGFIDDQRMVYVAVHGDNKTNKTTYSIDTLNVDTGKTETLFVNQPNDISQDFFTRGWLNEQRDTLVLSSYKGGQMWIFDLKHKTSRLMKGSYPNTWPQYSVHPAPDGNSFWFEDKLYDLQEKVIATIDMGKGFRMYPAVQWRKDSQYMVYHFTFNKDLKNVLGGEDGMIIAPQGIKFMNSVGKIVQKIEMDKTSSWRVELAGWVKGKDYAVLQYYQLHIKAEGNTPTKTDINYKLINLKTGELIHLQQADQMEQIVQPDWLESSQSSLITVDLFNNRFWGFNESVIQLNNTASDKPMWVHFDYGTFVATLYQYVDKTHQMNKHLLEKTQNIAFILSSKWIVDSEMNYTRISDSANGE
ncbi:hypothetical protein [Paenibacillus sp. GP183]|uniref:hypothetical protein n=1 Tax=Paenibacillus sp. GP183 TaxID=1882751 RepID=UPI0008981F3A|nr:hypothetical protein [Paenibacillus sp. GP183]SEB93357.1 hypothetical protein SAMN05443246_2396 [Paenibacillus sp. GP183]